MHAASLPDPLAKEQPSPSFIDYANEFIPDIVHGTGRIFSKDNSALAALGLGFTAIAFAMDNEAQDYFQRERPIGRLSKIGDRAGNPYYHIGFGAVLLSAGVTTNDLRLADTGMVVLQSLVITDAATLALKHASDRTRPNGQGSDSFPSGHASSTAALAASISEMYNWDMTIAGPLYCMAVLVSASRMQDNEHYFSDVAAGVTLGTLVGVSMAKYKKGQPAGSSKNAALSISPVYDHTLKGLLIGMRW